jgi:hypothetical protein
MQIEYRRMREKRGREEEARRTIKHLHGLCHKIHTVFVRRVVHYIPNINYKIYKFSPSSLLSTPYPLPPLSTLPSSPLLLHLIQLLEK